MSLVIDASVAVTWYFLDEQTDDTLAVLQRVVDGGAVAPTLWRLEVANVLQIGVRRKRIDVAFRDASLRDLARLKVATDTETTARAWSETLSLSDRHRLTVYDAAYLELAIRLGLPLASLDKELLAAARAAGVPTLP